MLTFKIKQKGFVISLVIIKKKLLKLLSIILCDTDLSLFHKIYFVGESIILF